MAIGSGGLFGSSGSRFQNKNLVEFRAGKMTMKGKMVHPDKRKGLVYVHQSEDQLMHFCWKDRTSGTVEDDFIIFPEDCVYQPVSQCTTGRVFLLKFKASGKKFFFWMQEPKSEKDDDLCKKVNEVLNNPPTPGSQRSGGTTPGDTDLQNLLSNMSQQQLAQLFGGAGANISSFLSGSGNFSSSRSGGGSSGGGGGGGESSTPMLVVPTTSTATTTNSATTATSSTTAVTATTTSASGGTATTSSSQAPIQLRDLQSILSGLSVPATASGEGDKSKTNVDLSSTLTAEALQPILSKEEFVDKLQEYLPQLGELGKLPPVEQLRGTVQSPQFRQALSMFSAAFQSGQLGPLIQQFSLGDDAVKAANSGDLEAFVKALQKSKESSDKKDKEDDMSVD